MRRWFEQLEEFAVDVILERRYGKRAMVLLWFLWALSFVYRGVVMFRLFLYQKRFKHERYVGCMVISIGNLSVGGTGKTPVVEKFARALTAGGRRVAILSRGYKSKQHPLLRRLVKKFQHEEEFKPRIVSDGKSVLLDSRMAGDEPYMLATNLQNVIVLVHKDRVKSALYAIEKMGCDTLLLDDGMQYLRLKHRLDVVLVDRQSPFGNGYLLPRGTLREPPRSLRRARYIFITKSESESDPELIRKIRKHNRTAEIIECAHRPQYLQDLVTGEQIPLDWLKGKFVGALSGIAKPDSFESAITQLGAKIEFATHFADHHRFSDKEIHQFVNRCIRRDVDAIITTEKDSVRFPRLAVQDVPIYFLRVEIEILSGHESWSSCVERICTKQPLIPPEKFFD